MVSQYVHDLCRQPATVSSELAKDPTETPASIIKRLYGTNSSTSSPNSFTIGRLDSQDALNLVDECGHWPQDKPSTLFLQAFADSLACLESDPMAGVVSPPLMGSHGTVPLTIISTMVDIMEHCATLIRNARKEVFFTTCVWKPSVAQNLIKEALIELSKRAGSRGDRVRVRIMYGQVGVWHVVDSHQTLKPASYNSKGIQLPLPKDIPNLDLQVIGFHKLFLGTLHAKVLVVDGSAAAIMSNNVENNPNLEMLTHLEGPIVASVYDTVLITWRKGVEILASAAEHAQEASDPSSIINSQAETRPEDLEDSRPNNDLQEEIARVNEKYSAEEGLSLLEAANRQLNLTAKNRIKPSGPEIAEKDKMVPYISTNTSQLVPMALVSRPPHGPFGSGSLHVPQNEAWLSLVRNAKRNIFIQSPDLNAEPMLKALALALRRGVEVTCYLSFGYNDAGEMLPGQGGTNEQATRKIIASLEGDKQAIRLLNIYNYIAKDQDHPIHEYLFSRTSHIKLLIVDDCVGVQGSGNQDTQSWYHSQEMNVMVDSPEICAQWRRGIEQNQNTRAFGKVSSDGAWRDSQGRPSDGYAGDPGVVDGLVKGVYGMIKKFMS